MTGAKECLGSTHKHVILSINTKHINSSPQRHGMQKKVLMVEARRIGRRGWTQVYDYESVVGVPSRASLLLSLLASAPRAAAAR